MYLVTRLSPEIYITCNTNFTQELTTSKYAQHATVRSMPYSLHGVKYCILLERVLNVSALGFLKLRVAWP